MLTPECSRDSFAVVKGILRFFDGDQFCSKMQHLHGAFYRIKQDAKYSNLLSCIFFDTNKSFPYSPDLQQDLLNLEQAGLLSTTNPTFTHTRIRETLKSTFDKYQRNKFAPEELSQLQEIAAALKTQLT